MAPPRPMMARAAMSKAVEPENAAPIERGEDDQASRQEFLAAEAVTEAPVVSSTDAYRMV